MNKILPASILLNVLFWSGVAVVLYIVGEAYYGSI